MKKVTVIGIGLIGGSMALTLKEKKFASHVIGVDANEANQKRALELGLVDEILPVEDAIKAADLVIVAIPVNAADKIMPTILDLVDKQVVMDVGSTKSDIIGAVANHPKRRRFVASHPMWGTEYSGPDAAIRGAFVNKATIICNRNDSDEDAVAVV